MASNHSIRARVAAAAAAACLAAAGVAAQPATGSNEATFNIFFNANQIGTERISVDRTPQGWTISGSGRLGAPLDIVTRRAELHYDGQWNPIDAYIEATIRNQPTTLRTTVQGTAANNEFTAGGKSAQKSDPIEPGSILLPSPSFAPYEALAARVRNAPPKSTLPVYVAPQAMMTATVGTTTKEQIQTANRLVNATRTRVTVGRAGMPPLEMEVWADAQSGRLLRLSIPAQSLEVVREDIGAVSARRVTASRPNDEQVRITGNGFSIAGTLSKPATPPAAPLPAVILVGGSGPTDRDEYVYGIPIFGQLAGALADAGFAVLRYDKRGVGQSGGRPESAALLDYADDLRAVVRFVADRKDLDRTRIAVVGHSEGGAVALLAAGREDRIRALVLIATAGVTGAELNLAQVAHALERAGRGEAEQQATLDMQRRIQQAVLTGKGWEGLPPPIRLQADTPWFQSFLAYDPARAMREVDQPVLIVHGTLDKQVDPSNATRLAELANARKRGFPAEVVLLPSVNHLLVPAVTGEVDEYGSLPATQISPDVGKSIAAWLPRAFARQ